MWIKCYNKVTEAYIKVYLVRMGIHNTATDAQEI